MPRKKKGAAESRPEHSPLGGSGADRWVNCSGSQALIDKLKELHPGFVEDDSEYAVEGRMAHKMGEHCLTKGINETWIAMGDFPEMTQEDARAVQVYLDYMARHAGKRMLIEHEIQHPAFHPLMYGRVDAMVFDPEPGIALEIDDYKHGVGVSVGANNLQERYYGFCAISGERWPADIPRLDDTARIRLVIIQPRDHNPEGPIRSVVVTAAELRNWAYNELRPAMQRVGEANFSMGDHCQFCPAKLVCPKMRKLGTDAALVANEMLKPVEEFDLSVMDDEWLGSWYEKLKLLDMFKKSIRDETAKRMLKHGKDIPGAKRVYALVDRVWKTEATLPQTDPDIPGVTMPAPLFAIFGDNAWEPAKVKSPAVIEKLPGGPQFVAEYAMKPTSALTIAPLSDKRPAQKPQTLEEIFAGVEAPTA